MKKVAMVVSNILLAVAVVVPVPADAALDVAAARCRGAVAAGYGKLVAASLGTIGKCHDARNAGRIDAGVDCNDAGRAGADAKVERARRKLTTTIERRCGDTEMLAGRFPYYVSCPQPCADAAPNPIESMADVASCLSCLGPVQAAATTEMTLGNPVGLGKEASTCHASIARGYGRYLARLLTARRSCQSDEDVTVGPALATCSEYDDDKTTAALLAAEADMGERCSGVDLDSLDSCAGADLDSFRACLLEQYEALVGAAFTAAYELPATLCPTSVRATVAASGGAGGSGGSSVSLGWTGAAHHVDVPDMVAFTLDVNCPGETAGACGECSIDGISADDADNLRHARCAEDVKVGCAAPGATDPGCPGSGECAWFAGPPLPMSAGGAPTCTLHRIGDDLTGTFDADSSDMTLALDVRAIVHNGYTQTQPCSVCEGDAVAQDGIKDGLCSGGHPSLAGARCDVQGFDTSFSTNGFDAVSGLSLDCPPHPAENVSGAGLPLALPLLTASTSMPFEDACDGALSGRMCACGVCSLDNGVGCTSDSDCAGPGLGVCSRGSGPDRSPNSCTDYVCEPSDDGTGSGTCSDATPLQKFCDGFVRADGRGVIACLSDADCTALQCPGGDCGSCAIEQSTPCFPDPIAVEGSVGSGGVVVAGVTCVPPLSGAGKNAAFGLPGPATVRLDVAVEPRFD